jgi:pimeloyl-[acyl-carrier protein] methyl ester esterase
MSEIPSRPAGTPELSYEVSGSGERAVVFIHGFGGNRLWWRWQTESMAAGDRGIAIDLPGHGQSGWSGDNLSDMAEGVRAVLEREGVHKAVFVASSFGGLVAMKLWEKVPAAVDRFVLAGSLPRFTRDAGYPAGLDTDQIRKLSGQLDGDIESVLEMFFRSLFTRLERENERYSQIKALRRLGARPRREALKGFLDILEKTDLRPVLKTVTVPSLFILGEGDPLCPPKSAKALQTLLPEAKVEIMKGVGHFPFQTQSAQFNLLVKGFLGA